MHQTNPDAFGNCRQVLEQNRRNVPPLFFEIDNNSEFLTTNTNLSFFYGKVFEVK